MPRPATGGLTFTTIPARSSKWTARAGCHAERVSRYLTPSVARAVQVERLQVPSSILSKWCRVTAETNGTSKWTRSAATPSAASHRPSCEEPETEDAALACAAGRLGPIEPHHVTGWAPPSGAEVHREERGAKFARTARHRPRHLFELEMQFRCRCARRVSRVRPRGGQLARDIRGRAR